MSQFDREQRNTQRRSYTFGAELSGLNRPRQWLGAILATLVTLGVLGLIALVAFG